MLVIPFQTVPSPSIKHSSVSDLCIMLSKGTVWRDKKNVRTNVLYLSLETFDDELQAMDFARAKIHSLVAVREAEQEASPAHLDPEAMKFKEVEERFLRQFNMPEEEKLVNCEQPFPCC